MFLSRRGLEAIVNADRAHGCPKSLEDATVGQCLLDFANIRCRHHSREVLGKITANHMKGRNILEAAVVETRQPDEMRALWHRLNELGAVELSSSASS